MACFDCILISTEDLVYFTLIYSPWFHDFSISCSTCTKSTKSMKSNGNISTEGAIVLYFVLEKALCYTQVKVFLFSNLFGNVFSNFRSNSRNNATICETPMLKKYFNSWKKVFSSLKTRFSKCPRYFHVLAYFIQINVISLSSDGAVICL